MYNIDAEWGEVKVNFKRGQVVLVMDASEAHAHLLRREHQSAYFAQVSSTLWVVVLRFHVEDLANIDEVEKGKVRYVSSRRYLITLSPNRPPSSV